MQFEHPEDREFFLNFLAHGNEQLFEEKYSQYFDFRNSEIKRKEFNSIRNDIYNKFVSERGLSCQLKISEDCSKSGRFAIDHFVPLQGNELNKHLRGMKRTGIAKVPAQSFGSNHIDNLLLACSECNRAKSYFFWKHRYKVLLIEDDNYFDELNLGRLTLPEGEVRFEITRWKAMPQNYLKEIGRLRPDIIAFHSAESQDKNFETIRELQGDSGLKSIPIFLSGYFGSRVPLRDWCGAGIIDFVATFKSRDILEHYMAYLTNPRKYRKERSLCSVIEIKKK